MSSKDPYNWPSAASDIAFLLFLAFIFWLILR